jgi:hypothetical protein
MLVSRLCLIRVRLIDYHDYSDLSFTGIFNKSPVSFVNEMDLPFRMSVLIMNLLQIKNARFVSHFMCFVLCASSHYWISAVPSFLSDLT